MNENKNLQSIPDAPIGDTPIADTPSGSLACIPPLGSLEAYRSAVFALPMLEVEEERALATRFRDENDLDAAWQLVSAHLRFVVRIARGYDGYGLAQADLIQEGNIGLMKAVKRFDPNMGVRLVSFAVHWVRAEIHEFILRNWRIVRVATTKAQRKLFFNLRRSHKRLGWMSQREMEDIADDLGVDAKTVAEMEKRMNAQDTAFDPLIENDSDSDRPKLAPSGYLQDMRFEPSVLVEKEEREHRRSQALAEALEALDERSRKIIVKRWIDTQKATLHELARECGVSAERIRQLEKKALAKLKMLIDPDLV